LLKVDIALKDACDQALDYNREVEKPRFISGNHMKNAVLRSWILCIGALLAGLVLATPVKANLPMQQPTVSIATVTGTPIGAYIVVNSDMDQINVRSRPDPLSDKIGVLLSGQKVPAKGKYTVWIQIEYPGVAGGIGWIYAPYVSIHNGELPLIEPPPTPTLQYTLTIDPTLAAQFIVTPAPSRLPTYTAPPPLVIPTYASSVKQQRIAEVPIGLVIVGLAALGVFMGFLSLIRGR
jgi:hypothetical protein